MMNIRVITLGKLKESFWKDAQVEYLKRLRPYAKIELVEIPEVSFGSLDDRERVTKKEAEIVLKKIADDDVVIALDEHGKEFPSVQLAEFFKTKSAHGERLVCIIGGPLGLHKMLRGRAQFTLSLSQLTFPHQMARIILLEQIYRSHTILTGKQYHY